MLKCLPLPHPEAVQRLVSTTSYAFVEPLLWASGPQLSWRSPMVNVQWQHGSSFKFMDIWTYWCLIGALLVLVHVGLCQSLHWLLIAEGCSISGANQPDLDRLASHRHLKKMNAARQLTARRLDVLQGPLAAKTNCNIENFRVMKAQIHHDLIHHHQRTYITRPVSHETSNNPQIALMRLSLASVFLTHFIIPL